MKGDPSATVFLNKQCCTKKVLPGILYKRPEINPKLPGRDGFMMGAMDTLLMVDRTNAVLVVAKVLRLTMA